MTTRRDRNRELEATQHLHRHDDDLDMFDSVLEQLKTKLDRLTWLLATASISGSTAILVWAIQYGGER